MSLSAFYQLPEELLTHIADYCSASEAKTDLRTLKDLRLAHPLFAHLKYTKQALFETIYLRADPQRLASQDVAKSVGPFVVNVIVEPITLRRSTCQALNFSVMKARQQYEQEVFQLVRNGAVHLMASALQHFSNLQSVTVIESKTPSDKDVLVPKGDSLFDLVLQVLTEANVKLKHFVIAHSPHPDFDWGRRFGCLTNLDLSELKTLHFHPTSDTREEIIWQYNPDPFGGAPPPLVAGLEPDATLRQMLVDCSPSLEELSCRCPALILGKSWRTLGRPQCPVLRKVEVSDCLLSAPAFSEWLGTCNSLEDLTLARLHPSSGDGLSHWQPIFKAVREHPRRITVTLTQVDIWVELRWMLTLHHHTSQPADMTTGCYPPRLCSRLKDYMSNLTEWFFEDEQEDIGWV